LDNRDKQIIIDALDALALALKDHKWTNRERKLYERAIAILT
jgi:hypothetical protein